MIKKLITIILILTFALQSTNAFALRTPAAHKTDIAKQIKGAMHQGIDEEHVPLPSAQEIEAIISKAGLTMSQVRSFRFSFYRKVWREMERDPVSLEEHIKVFDYLWANGRSGTRAFPQGLKIALIEKKDLHIVPWILSGYITPNEMHILKKNFALSQKDEEFLWAVFHDTEESFGNRVFRNFPEAAQTALGKAILDADGTARVLDLGCGPNGATIKSMKEIFGDKIEGAGIDIALRDEIDQPVKLRKGDMRQLPFEDSSFDIVYEAAVLEYFKNDPDLEMVFKEIARVLKPGGRLFLFGAGRFENDIKQKAMRYLGSGFQVERGIPFTVVKSAPGKDRIAGAMHEGTDDRAAALIEKLAPKEQRLIYAMLKALYGDTDEAVAVLLVKDDVSLTLEMVRQYLDAREDIDEFRKVRNKVKEGLRAQLLRSMPYEQASILVTEYFGAYRGSAMNILALREEALKLALWQDKPVKDMLQAALVQISGSPFGRHRKKWLKAELEYLNNGKVFTPGDLDRLAEWLSGLFTGRVVIRDWGQDTHIRRPFNCRFSISEDFGSGQTMSAGGLDEYARHKRMGDLADTQAKQEIIYRAYKDWEKQYKFAPGGDANLARKLFYREITEKYGLRLLGSEEACAGKIEAAVLVIQLLPDAMLGSSQIKHALRAGIDLSAHRLSAARLAHYDDKEGALGVQPTGFTVEEFAETLLHELGHSHESFHLHKPDFARLLDKMEDDLYAIPALSQSGSERRFYIKNTPEELFAETFMHYVLHGEMMSQGLPGLVNDNELWKKVYAYYRDNIFHGVEYRVQSRKLVAIQAAAGDAKIAGAMHETIGQQADNRGIEQDIRKAVEKYLRDKEVDEDALPGIKALMSKEGALSEKERLVLAFYMFAKELVNSGKVELELSELFEQASEGFGQSEKQKAIDSTDRKADIVIADAFATTARSLIFAAQLGAWQRIEEKLTDLNQKASRFGLYLFIDKGAGEVFVGNVDGTQYYQAVISGDKRSAKVLLVNPIIRHIDVGGHSGYYYKLPGSEIEIEVPAVVFVDQRFSSRESVRMMVAHELTHRLHGLLLESTQQNDAPESMDLAVYTEVVAFLGSLISADPRYTLRRMIEMYSGMSGDKSHEGAEYAAAIRYVFSGLEKELGEDLRLENCSIVEMMGKVRKISGRKINQAAKQMLAREAPGFGQALVELLEKMPIKEKCQAYPEKAISFRVLKNLVDATGKAQGQVLAMLESASKQELIDILRKEQGKTDEEIAYLLAPMLDLDDEIVLGLLKKKALMGPVIIGEERCFIGAIRDKEGMGRALEKWFSQANGEKRYFDKKQWLNALDRMEESLMVKIETTSGKVLGIGCAHKGMCRLDKDTRGQKSVLKDVYYFDLMEISEEYRGRGLGKVLTAKVIEQSFRDTSLERGVKGALVLHPAEDSEYVDQQQGKRARDFYYKLGFRILNPGDELSTGNEESLYLIITPTKAKLLLETVVKQVKTGRYFDAILPGNIKGAMHETATAPKKAAMSLLGIGQEQALDGRSIVVGYSPKALENGGIKKLVPAVAAAMAGYNGCFVVLSHETKDQEKDLKDQVRNLDAKVKDRILIVDSRMLKKFLLGFKQDDRCAVKYIRTEAEQPIPELGAENNGLIPDIDGSFVTDRFEFEFKEAVANLLQV